MRVRLRRVLLRRNSEKSSLSLSSADAAGLLPPFCAKFCRAPAIGSFCRLSSSS